MTMPLRFDPPPFAVDLRKRDAGPSVRAASPPPIFIRQPEPAAETVQKRRTKLWELSSHLHCSIVGTCLASGELRQVLGKAGCDCAGASDHELHAQGVLLAGRRDGAAKRLNKALDHRHRLALHQFDKARSPEEVRALWREAAKRGDIPGAYWAVLTHPAASEALVREVFGEVHMLSHLVGAANRADIRRLAALEAENGALQDKLRRQQAQLRDGITARDAKIRELSALLARCIAENAGGCGAEDIASERAALTRLVAELERRLAAETGRRGAAEARVERLAEASRRDREQRAAAERREAALRDEVAALEASLAPAASSECAAHGAPLRLEGLSLLYVGGRPHQLGQLRALGEARGACFLHHDGGVEDRSGLLAGLVSRADVVMFPVDCVSHDAVATVKRLCRQAAKPYLPLRSAGISSFAAALGRVRRQEAGMAAPT